MELSWSPRHIHSRRLGIARQLPNGKLVATSAAKLDRSTVFAKLRACHSAGMALFKSPVPRTLAQYISSAKSLRSLLSDIAPPGVGNSDYGVPWLIRSHIFGELRARG